MRPIVEARNVTKTFQQRRGLFSPLQVFRAVDGVSIAVPRGQTLALVGESGSGKSTLARLMLGLIKPDSGQIVFDGRDAASMDAPELAALRRTHQIVFQDPLLSLNPRRSIGENIARPLANAGFRGREIKRRVADLLGLVGLPSQFSERYSSELSGGQCQRVAIARSLALQPQFLVLDEPVSALDVSIQAQILNLLLDLQEQLDLAYLFVTHDLKLVSYMARDAAVMHRGKIVECGPSGKLFSAPSDPYTINLLRGVLRLDAPPDWDALANFESAAGSSEIERQTNGA